SLLNSIFFFFFFFSSRRRHTRSKRDWSSDVCSSDLLGRLIIQQKRVFPHVHDEQRGKAGDTPRLMERDPMIRQTAIGRVLEADRDRKSVVKGKSVGGGGRGMIKKETRRRESESRE